MLMDAVAPPPFSLNLIVGGSGESGGCTDRDNRDVLSVNQRMPCIVYRHILYLAMFPVSSREYVNLKHNKNNIYVCTVLELD